MWNDRRRPPRKRRCSAHRTNWRDDLRVVPLSRQSRPHHRSALECRTDSRFPIHSFLADGAVAHEAWADTEVSPPSGTTGDALPENGASAPIEQTGGMTSVSSHSCGRAALIIVPASSAEPIPDSRFTVSSKTAQLRLRLGPTRRSALHLERQGTPSPKTAPQPRIDPYFAKVRKSNAESAKRGRPSWPKSA